MKVSAGIRPRLLAAGAVGAVAAVRAAGAAGAGGGAVFGAVKQAVADVEPAEGDNYRHDYPLNHLFDSSMF